jgi:hypothetical protein
MAFAYFGKLIQLESLFRWLAFLVFTFSSLSFLDRYSKPVHRLLFFCLVKMIMLLSALSLQEEERHRLQVQSLN